MVMRADVLFSLVLAVMNVGVLITARGRVVRFLAIVALVIVVLHVVALLIPA
jgi:hypothetical protein